jgi:DNA-binding ferritin-like protein (Dps family)
MINYFKKMRAEKKAYRDYRKRVNALPPEFKQAQDALEKYLMNWAKGSGIYDILGSVLEMFEGAAADGSSVEDVVGADIADFADNLLSEYPEETWIDKKRNQLRKSYKKNS